MRCPSCDLTVAECATRLNAHQGTCCHYCNHEGDE